MKKIIIIALALFFLLLVGGVGWVVIDTVSGYNTLVRDDSGPLAVEVESEMLVRLRKEIAESKWRVHASGESELASLLVEMGFSNGFEGLAEFFEYQITPFDWKNLEQNQFNLIIGTIRQGLVPEASDGTFHLNESRDFGVIFVREGILQFYTASDDGLNDGILTSLPQPSNKSVEDNSVTRSALHSVPHF